MLTTELQQLNALQHVTTSCHRILNFLISSICFEFKLWALFAVYCQSTNPNVGDRLCHFSNSSRKWLCFITTCRAKKSRRLCKPKTSFLKALYMNRGIRWWHQLLKRTNSEPPHRRHLIVIDLLHPGWVHLHPLSQRVIGTSWFSVILKSRWQHVFNKADVCNKEDEANIL